MQDYEKLIKEIENLKKEIPFFYVGKTYLNNNIICFIVLALEVMLKYIGLPSPHKLTGGLLVSIVSPTSRKVIQFAAVSTTLPS